MKMVERMARAMSEVNPVNYPYDGEFSDRAKWDGLALAALKAILEPSEGMLLCIHDHQPTAHDLWRGAIQAAISEAQGE